MILRERSKVPIVMDREVPAYGLHIKKDPDRLSSVQGAMAIARRQYRHMNRCPIGANASLETIGEDALIVLLMCGMYEPLWQTALLVILWTLR